MVLYDCSYGSHERNTADIYIPDNPVSETGLILFIHGGGWTGYDKSVHTPDAENGSALGYICASMNYRYADGSTVISDILDDITQALLTVKTVCAGRGFNLERVILAGGSSGAHLSLMYAFLRYEESPLTPVAVFGRCPPVDLADPGIFQGLSGEFESFKYETLCAVSGLEITKDNFSSPDNLAALRRISPISYIDRCWVDIALCQGLKDELVPYTQVAGFAKALSESGAHIDFITYENSGHGLDSDPEKTQAVKDLMKLYCSRYL